ncbi:hypothetical protein G7Y89_g6429 [Cudoniella acicularis]|uniref:Uncharacterized protein n=1 Tax=Cudoniella acicularis TaxID=354080 RepID=A0A8H4RLY3_9HELO|nr:hypothetical protein G7Y89_g6429 [Cudoniella acicularis]
MKFRSSFVWRCFILSVPPSHILSPNVNFNQVINLNGDMQLNTLVFPDNSKIETFSQTQRQVIVNQNPSPLTANHVIGSTGQPFVQLSQNSMTIATNNATDLVGAQIELPINQATLDQNGITADNTFVAMLSPDRQAWMVMEGQKSVNTTDRTVRLVKLNSIDGEYMAIGRKTVETSNVLSPFGQSTTQQSVNITGSGIQELEFTDGFRMSVRANMPMTINTDVVNGVSTSMLTNGVMPVNNYRYLVSSNLAGVIPNLNQMMAVVQLPINAIRVMDMAQKMGMGANSTVSLGIAQRVVLQNPGGASGGSLSPAPQKRQKSASSKASKSTTGTKSSAAKSSVAKTSAAKASATSSVEAATSAAPEAASAKSSTADSASGEASAAADGASGAASSPEASASEGAVSGASSTEASATESAASGASASSAPPAAGASATSTTQAPQGTTGQGPSNSQNQNPAATQLLLSPTFTPISARAVLDMTNSRIAVPVSQLDGEFILTMGTPGTSQAGVTQEQGQTGGASTQSQGGLTVTMAELTALVKQQKNGGIMPVWQMMADFMNQELQSQNQNGVIKQRSRSRSSRTDDVKLLLCGPPPMISAMKKSAESLGFKKAKPVSKLEDQVFAF